MSTLQSTVQVLEKLSQWQWAYETVYHLCLVKVLLLHTLLLIFPILSFSLFYFSLLISFFLLLCLFLFSYFSLYFFFLNNFRLDHNMKILLLHSSHQSHNLGQFPLTNPLPILKSIHVILIRCPKYYLVSTASELIITKFSDFCIGKCIL